MDTEVGLILAFVAQAAAVAYWGGQIRQRLTDLDPEVTSLRKDRHAAKNTLTEHGFRISNLEERVEDLEQKLGG